MFSFHKPKVYRSAQGCCICKAKSSSSRFTDSKKYENDFIECFQLSSPRCGEICNACVLLVKRFKRLPPGSERHWSHVVDARIGPGIKSMNKFKKRKEERQQNDSIVGYAREFADQSNSQNTENDIRFPDRLGNFFRKTKKRASKEPLVTSQIESESDENSEPNSQCEIQVRLMSGVLPEHYKQMPIGLIGKVRRRKSYHPLKNGRININRSVSVIDQDVWIKVKSCCGYVYENPAIGALLVDFTNLTNYCSIHKRGMKIVTSVGNVAQPTKKSVVSMPLKKQHMLSKRYLENIDLIEDDASRTDSFANNKMSNKTKTVSAHVQNAKVEIPNDYNPIRCNTGNQNGMNTKKSNKLLDVLNVTKFSDNSSDSGYDETLHDTAQLNQIAKIGASRPVILSNGVKIHVQPQNLLLAANLAGVSQTAIQTTQANMRATLNRQRPHLDKPGQPIGGPNVNGNTFA